VQKNSPSMRRPQLVTSGAEARDFQQLYRRHKCVKFHKCLLHPEATYGQ
jgi:hypothetical protein